MTTNISFWNTIIEYLERKVSCVLYVVAAAEKGTPGNPGFAMAVSLEGSNQEAWGTIGGGIMEKNLREEAAQALKRGQHLSFLRKLHHYKRSEGSVQESGLICSGSETIAACTLTERDKPTIERIITALRETQPLQIQISRAGLAATPINVPIPRFHLASPESDGWCYSELLGAPDTVIIAGGGHVGLALSQQMALLGMYVVVVDAREHLETMQQNTFANELHTASYQEFGRIVESYAGRRRFIVIATAAYKTDIEALCSLAEMPSVLEYIGLMGSKAKITTIFRDMRLAGISESWLQRISAPIGVQINSDTPAEIAVSIAAEIIAAKNTH